MSADLDLEEVFGPGLIAALEQVVERAVERKLAERRPSEQKFLTVKEAAEISSHPEGTIRQWLAKGTLTNYGRRRAPRVKLSDILDLDGPRGG
jgi:hypothetical protein